jgi:hypothetical protein
MSRDYFSVDRRGFYRVGGVLDLFDECPLDASFVAVEAFITPEQLHAHLTELFPDGLSLHGWDYMTRQTDFISSGNQNYSNYEVTLELVLEYVRRAAFPKVSSRLQCYFAFGSLEQAQTFKAAQARELNIYRLAADVVLTLDQRWLRLGNQNAIGSYSAHKYWSGAAATNPK